MLENERRFYENNRTSLVNQYLNRYVVISGDKVIASYDDENVAYFETVKSIPLGKFMIHHVVEPEEVVRISPFVSGYAQ